MCRVMVFRVDDESLDPPDVAVRGMYVFAAAYVHVSHRHAVVGDERGSASHTHATHAHAQPVVRPCEHLSVSVARLLAPFQQEMSLLSIRERVELGCAAPQVNPLGRRVDAVSSVWLGRVASLAEAGGVAPGGLVSRLAGIDWTAGYSLLTDVSSASIPGMARARGCAGGCGARRLRQLRIVRQRRGVQDARADRGRRQIGGRRRGDRPRCRLNCQRRKADISRYGTRCGQGREGTALAGRTQHRADRRRPSRLHQRERRLLQPLRRRRGRPAAPGEMAEGVSCERGSWRRSPRSPNCAS